MPALFADGFPAGILGYDAVGLLGHGASGLVFKARQRSTGQFVAIKVPHAAPEHDPAATRRLHQRLHHEARLCAALHHPQVVRLIDKGLAAGSRPYAVFEFLEGETLGERLLRRGPLPAARTQALMAQLLDVLAWLHGRGIVHRDLKPQNVMLASTGEDGFAKLLDFGIASLGAAAGPAAGEGTPAYCAPEQLLGLPCGPQTDLYAWGLLFLECLEGRPVLRDLSVGGMRRWQLGPAPVPLPEPLRGHPLAALLRRVLDKDPQRRAADAAALRRELVRLAPPPAFAAPPAREPPAAAETQDGPQAEGGPARLAVLCMALRLEPSGTSGLAVADLQAMRQEQLAWCDRALREGGAAAAGMLGDLLLFHYPGAGGGSAHLQHAAQAALDLLASARRRGRLLQLRHGVRLRLCAGLAVLEADGPPSAADLNRAANRALHLACRAPDAVLLAGPEVRAALPRLGRFEPWHGSGPPAFRVLAP